MTGATADPGRGRALAVLVGMGVVVLALLAGLGYALVSAAGGSTGPAAAPGTATPGASPLSPGAASPGADPNSLSALEDYVANAPMMVLPSSAAQPQALVTETAGPTINIPAPGPPVPGGPPVPTGFPETPEGALGQLAAIDEAALSTTDLGTVREVYDWAAMPGAVPEDQWTPEVGVTALDESLGDNIALASASFQVLEGQDKGGVVNVKDFEVVCVLGQWGVTGGQLAQSGVADCQRMVWSDGRWRIGPGSQPALPSPVWPGSVASVRAGWRALNRD